MKSTALQKPLLEWHQITLNDFMNVEIEFRPAKILYNSFFYAFWVIGKIFYAFQELFLHDPSVHHETKHFGVKIEKELISLFDRAYSLEEKD